MSEKVQEPSLRPPTLSDALALARLHVKVWKDTYGRLLGAQYFDAAAVQERSEMWAVILENQSARSSVLVAEHQDELIAFGHAGSSFEPNPARPLQLHALYVDQEWQRRGIGRVLLERVLGDERAQVWVAESNVRAQRFYSTIGFTPDDARSTSGPLPEIRFVR